MWTNRDELDLCCLKYYVKVIAVKHKKTSYVQAGFFKIFVNNSFPTYSFPVYSHDTKWPADCCWLPAGLLYHYQKLST